MANSLHSFITNQRPVWRVLLNIKAASSQHYMSGNIVCNKGRSQRKARSELIIICFNEGKLISTNFRKCRKTKLNLINGTLLAYVRIFKVNFSWLLIIWLTFSLKNVAFTKLMRSKLNMHNKT
jgi:hypothetical protein